MKIKKDTFIFAVVCMTIGLLGLVTLKSWAGGESCTTSDGQTYEVPANKQLVFIPKLWNPDNLAYVVTGKHMMPPVTVTSRKCDSKLVISPAFCDPKTGEEVTND